MCYRVPIFGVYVVVSFLVSALSLSNRKPCITNPMSILYISPMTDKTTTHHMVVSIFFYIIIPNITPAIFYLLKGDHNPKP